MINCVYIYNIHTIFVLFILDIFIVLPPSEATKLIFFCSGFIDVLYRFSFPKCWIATKQNGLLYYDYLHS